MKEVPISQRTSIIFSTGKFDSRGRPIPGLAKLPEVQQDPPPKQSMATSYNMQPNEKYPPPPVPLSSLNFGSNSSARNDSTGKIYVGGMPPSLSEAHLHVYFSQFGTVLNVTLIRDRETGKSNTPFL